MIFIGKPSYGQVQLKDGFLTSSPVHLKLNRVDIVYKKLLLLETEVGFCMSVHFALNCTAWHMQNPGPSTHFISTAHVQVIAEENTALIIKKHDILHITKTRLGSGIKTKLIGHRLSEREI